MHFNREVHSYSFFPLFIAAHKQTFLGFILEVSIFNFLLFIYLFI
jgi:hypothetical protein